MQEFLAALGADRRPADQKLCSLYAKMAELDKASGGKLGLLKTDLEPVLQQLGQRVSLDRVLVLAKQEPSAASALFGKLAPEQLAKAKAALLAELSDPGASHITNLKLIAAITALAGPDVAAVAGLDFECTEAFVAEMDGLARAYLAGEIPKVEYEKAAAALSADALFAPFKNDPRIAAITEKVKLKVEAKILKAPEDQQRAAILEDLQTLEH